jgi:hypothetical protein
VATVSPPSISTTSANPTPTSEKDDAENDEGFALIPPHMVLESSDREDEGTRPLSSAARVSRSPKVPGNERQEEQPVPSVVANRTRQKSKAVASPEAPPDDQQGSDDGDDRVAGKKRKVKVEVEVEEGGSPSKKQKAGAGKSKAAATRKPAVRKKHSCGQVILPGCKMSDVKL